MRTRSLEPTEAYAHLPIVSATRIALFQRCPLEYVARYVLALPVPTNSYAVVGSAVHATLQHMWEHEYQAHELPYIYHTYVMQYATEANLVIPSHLYQDGLMLVSFFRKHAFPRPMYIEHEFLVPFPKEQPICLLHGFMDYVFEDGVVDIKTARQKPTSLQTSTQFLVYYYAFSVLFDRPPAFVTWYHLRTNEHIPLVDPDLQVLERQVRALLDAHQRQAWASYTPCERCFSPEVCATARILASTL